MTKISTFTRVAKAHLIFEGFLVLTWTVVMFIFNFNMSAAEGYEYRLALGFSFLHFIGIPTAIWTVLNETINRAYIIPWAAFIIFASSMASDVNGLLSIALGFVPRTTEWAWVIMMILSSLFAASTLIAITWYTFWFVLPFSRLKGLPSGPDGEEEVKVKARMKKEDDLRTSLLKHRVGRF